MREWQPAAGGFLDGQRASNPMAPWGELPFSHVRRWSALVVVLLPALLVGWVGIDRSPITWTDEVFYTDTARTLAQEHRFVAPVFAGVRGLDQHFFLQPPLAFFERALVFTLFGFGKWQTRVPGLFEYGLAIALIYLIVARLTRAQKTSSWMAACAAALFACDAGVIESYRSGRPDMLGVCLALSALLVLVSESRSWMRWAGAGLLSGAAAISHPAFLVLLPGALCGAVLAKSGTRNELLRRVLLWGVGCALPLAVWGAFILQAPGAWAEQFLSHVRGTVGDGRSSGLLGALMNPLLHLTSYFRPMPVVALAIFGSLVVGARRLTGLQRVPLAFGASAALLLFSGESFLKLIVAFAYITAAVAASVLASESRRLTSHRMRLATIVLVVSVMPIPLARLAVVVAQWSARDEKPLVDLIRREAMPGALIAGIPQGYFAAVENGHPFVYSEPLFGVRTTVTAKDVDEFKASMDRLRPDYLLLFSEQDPEDVAKYLPAATFSSVATYVPRMSGFQFLRKSTYDLRLWKVSYDDRQLAARTRLDRR